MLVLDLTRLKNCKQYAAFRTPAQVLSCHMYLLNIRPLKRKQSYSKGNNCLQVHANQGSKILHEHFGFHWYEDFLLTQSAQKLKILDLFSIAAGLCTSNQQNNCTRKSRYKSLKRICHVHTGTINCLLWVSRMKIQVFWDVITCRLTNSSWHFERLLCLHHQCLAVQYASWINLPWQWRQYSPSKH